MSASLQHVIFTEMPIVNQTSVLEIFDQMDDILEFCVRRIVGFKSTVHCLVDISSEIGSSLTHGRLIFNRPAGDSIKVPKKDKVKVPKTYGGPSKLEDLLTYNNESDHESLLFLKKVFKIYNCWTSGFVTVEDILGLNLCRATYEAILQDFITRTTDYKSLCLRSSRLREIFNESAEVDPVLYEELASIEERMEYIETNVGCERSRLWAIQHQVQTEMARYKKLKEHVYHAYLRIVYKIAREKATAEQQVLENFQNGSIGLLRAISTYNPTRGVFSSYAKTWSLQHILLKLKEEANAIRLPISIWQMNNDIVTTQTRLMTDANDYTVDLDVVAEESGLEHSRVVKITDYFQATRVVSMENQSSLDSSNQESRKEESYDPYEPLPFIDAHIDLLTPRQSFILFLIYGMYERLPGDLPDNPVAIEKERLRQKIAEKMYAVPAAPRSRESS